VIIVYESDFKLTNEHAVLNEKQYMYTNTTTEFAHNIFINIYNNKTHT